MTNLDRQAELSALRAEVVAIVLEAYAYHIRHPLETTDTGPMDGAALALADKLREPEKCFSCGQEVKHDD